MAKKYVRCPKCGHTATASQWDDQTREDYGIKAGAPYMSCTESRDSLKEVEATFVCPHCEEEIPGVELITDNDTIPEE